MVEIIKSGINTDLKSGRVYETLEEDTRQKLDRLYTTAQKHSIFVFSADDFFVKDGEYRFDGRLLGQAHGDCLKRYTERVREATPQDLLIVNNTNCTIEEVAPYIALAQAYGHWLEVVTVLAGDLVKPARYNKHKTPIDAIIRQASKLNESISLFPAWWPQTFVYNWT